MTHKRARKLAKKYFGPKAYAIEITKLGTPVCNITVTNPKRIGVDVSEILRLPLGCGKTWKQALWVAKNSELGMEMRNSPGGDLGGSNQPDDPKPQPKPKNRTTGVPRADLEGSKRYCIHELNAPAGSFTGGPFKTRKKAVACLGEGEEIVLVRPGKKDRVVCPGCARIKCQCPHPEGKIRKR